MTDKCMKCGRTESQITADATSLGLLQEFQGGVYSCCQIVAWADEQWLAWSEVALQDNGLVGHATDRPHIDDSDSEGVLVTVRSRGRQVPWYRQL